MSSAPTTMAPRMAATTMASKCERVTGSAVHSSRLSVENWEDGGRGEAGRRGIRRKEMASAWAERYCTFVMLH